MGMYTADVGELLEFLGQIAPGAYAAQQDTGWMSVQDYHRVFIILHVGTMGALGTIDLDVEQATDTTGTGMKNVTGFSITQLTQAGGDSDGVVILDLQMEQLDVSNNYDAINVEVTPLVAFSDFGVTVWGCSSRTKPASVAGLLQHVT